jgi:copper(I)-binding protein
MRNYLKCAAAIAFLALTLNVHAQVSVKDAWIRATVPQQKATGAFFQIQSSENARLVAVQTSAAGIAEIHEMKMDNNIMKMRQLESLDLPAGKTVELKPGSFHLMLMDLKKQIKPGDVIPMTLTIEAKEKKQVTIEVKVKARSLNSAEGHM